MLTRAGTQEVHPVWHATGTCTQKFPLVQYPRIEWAIPGNVCVWGYTGVGIQPVTAERICDAERSRLNVVELKVDGLCDKDRNYT